MKKLLLSLFVLITSTAAFSCTNFLFTKGATADGSTMITYAADSHVLYGELYHWDAADWPEGTMLDIYEWDTGKYMGQIPQVKHTYNVVGNMNEHQLAIGETTYGGLETLYHQSGAIMDYGSLIYIALQRAKTAREAIYVIADLMEKYGYASEGESFSIADKEEVWIMEIIGKGEGEKGAVWVARMIPDGYISGHANQARITTFPLEGNKSSISSTHLEDIYNKGITTAYHKDVISFAKKKGLYSGKDSDFSFCDVYCPLSFGGARGCEARVWAGFMKANKAQMAEYEDYARGDNLKHRFPLWIKPDRKLTLFDVYDIMRDHYEGTTMDMRNDVGAGPYACPYRWRPMDWKLDGKTYIHERATSTQQTGFSFVSQSRSWLPDAVGGILWWGVDDTYSSCYIPMHACMTKIPENVKVGNGSMLEYSPTSLFWTFNKVSNFIYSRYCDMIVDVQKVQKRLESQFYNEVIQYDSKLVHAYFTDPNEAVAIMTNFSAEKTLQTYNEWENLFVYLLVKYMDGYIKYEKDGQFETNGIDAKQAKFPMQPEYPEKWYRTIVNDCGKNIMSK